MEATTTEGLLAGLRRGDRGALARAITLVESTRPGEQAEARTLLRSCDLHRMRSVRLGITGIPGAGKSTLIDALGNALIDAGHRVAVLAVDPSSTRSGGSILGDKTRMERLAAREAAFIRPSPTAGTLGGVARRTREVIALCEEAGYDRILVETVGVGQSELAVDAMTDLTILLTVPGTGDELQGIKRGIMEAADIVAVHKADGTGTAAHVRARNDLRQALSLMPTRPSGRRAEVILSSALAPDGLRALLATLAGLIASDTAGGLFEQRRREQDRAWLCSTVEEDLLTAFHADPSVQEALLRAQDQVERGERDPYTLAAELIALFRTASGPLP